MFYQYQIKTMELLTFQKLMLLLLQVHYGLSICYFPGELQGKWATQLSTSRGARVGGPVQYQDIDIHYDTVLQWGNCHERVDNNVILSDSTGVPTCFRCISLNVVSPRVVQVWTLEINKCYNSETEAFAMCPSTDDIRTRKADEIMLYKRKSEFDEPQMHPVECPLNGRYRFTYRRGSNSVTAGSCDQPTSEFSNCPYGFGFNVEYNNCPYAPAQRTDLQCLGSWVGEDGNDYLAVMDTSIQDWHTEPIYKCGMFREEAGTGRVFLAFSEDSTCINNLTSPTHAFETYVLTSHPSPPLPPEVGRATCKFPRSLAGHWHHTYVDDDTVVFKDYVNYKSYSASCLQDMNDGERYIVYTRSHCGEWSYNCLWLKRRSANVMEFMLGLYDSETFDPSLCDYAKFGDMTSWTTQGKSLVEEPTSCPIVGTYAGELPDAQGICAQLYSDCESPQIMYYTMSECWNNSAVYEQREYQCLGQWEEEGRLYAFTYRRDIKTYECFVGVIKASGVVFIKEAGQVCSRGVQPEVLGMKLSRKEACTPPTRASQSAQPTEYLPQPTRPPWFKTTKPWKPITGRPRKPHSGTTGRSASPVLLFMAIVTVLSAVWRTQV